MNLYCRITGLAVTICILFGVRNTYAQPGANGTLRYGEIVRGQLSDENSEEFWSFTGQAKDLILIDLRAINMNSLDTYVTLLDAGGNTLLTDDDSGERLNSRIGLFELPESGGYQVKVSRFGGSGEYMLQVINLNTVPVIEPGKSLVGTVNSTQPSNFFLLKASRANTPWNLRIANDELYAEPFIALYDRTGLIVTTEQAETNAIDPFMTLPEQVYAVVISWNESSLSGSYELLLDQSNIQLLTEEMTQTGSLDYEVNFFQKHYFQGSAGETVRLTVTTTEGEIAPSVEVVSSDGNHRLFYNEGAAVRELTIQLSLPIDTVYVVTLTDGTYQEESGTYTISLERVEN